VKGVAWTNPGGKAVDPFGEESFTAGYSNLAFTKKKGNKLGVSFQLDIRCDWGVNGGGNTDISTGDEADITADNYKAIAEDLTPKLKEKSWVAKRDKYWSNAISSRHEKFHSTDDRDWAKGDGKRHIQSYLNKQTVTLSDDERKDDDVIRTKLTAVMKDAVDDLETVNIRDFYKGGAGSYYSYKGEIRAFGDGKGPYKSLVKKVKEKGKKLEKAKAKEAAAGGKP
jgi:hypothetical protein